MGDRVNVVLTCTECSARNYKTSRVRRAGAKPLELSKFCPKCRRHTLHKETK